MDVHHRIHGHPKRELSEIIFILIENDSLTLDQSLGFSFLGNFFCIILAG
jgi:hypothetical protein